MSLAVTLLVPLMLGLGFWQLDRADQKRAHQDTLFSRLASAPVAGRDTLAPEPFQRVRLEGRFEADRYFLVDNQVADGVVGYWVVQSFSTPQGVRWLVNRGWIAGGDHATVPGGRYREVQRVRSGVNRETNGFFICDRGRFGYDHVNHPERPRQARVDGQSASVSAARQAVPSGRCSFSTRPLTSAEMVTACSGSMSQEWLNGWRMPCPLKSGWKRPSPAPCVRRR